ncbi:MAG TPA: hypothetical protein VF131_21550, partial [Blastocatellia bacterium]|nr:hypothetical protein [Blastocatellia bacterium]
WISQAEYDEATAEWRGQKQPGGGGNPYQSKIAYLGRDYISLAFQRFRQNQIDEEQLADYLEMKPRHCPSSEFLGQRAGSFKGGSGSSG